MRLAIVRLRALVPILLFLTPGLPAAPHIPQIAKDGLHQLYSGNTEAAIDTFRGMQRAEPRHPIGYLLEANARWWRIYCEACEIKWNTIDAWKREEAPGDDEYFALCDNGIQLSELRLKRQPVAEWHFYAGMGYALKARLHALRDERRATARAGVKAREHLLEAARLDPELADTNLGLGLYNYYVDSLSAFVKVLRFFMGIPGGSKKEGMRQLEIAIARGEYSPVEARFYLAKNLRNIEQQYAQAIALLAPLAAEYPRNPMFHLMLGDFHAKLAHHAEAAASYRATLQLINGTNTPCATRLRQITTAALAALPGGGR